MLKWDHNDATTDFLLLSGLMPRQFAELLDDLAIVCVARKVDATADENADLCLQAQVRWFQPGTLDRPDVQSASDTAPTLTAGDSALGALTTPAKALLAGTLGANSNLTGFGTYVIDIGERLRAEEARIEAGSVLQIEFGPDDTPGTTDMDIEIAPPILCLRRHVGLYMSGNPGRNPRHD
ncbi:MAG: hypothetical protein IT370_18710 [Deltaproteobacteria bacterium]|nr:hypothetical protein [Deltaproteobacteria bacterium]